MPFEPRSEAFSLSCRQHRAKRGRQHDTLVLRLVADRALISDFAGTVPPPYVAMAISDLCDFDAHTYATSENFHKVVDSQALRKSGAPLSQLVGCTCGGPPLLRAVSQRRYLGLLAAGGTDDDGAALRCLRLY